MTAVGFGLTQQDDAPNGLSFAPGLACGPVAKAKPLEGYHLGGDQFRGCAFEEIVEMDQPGREHRLALLEPQAGRMAGRGKVLGEFGSCGRFARIMQSIGNSADQPLDVEEGHGRGCGAIWLPKLSGLWQFEPIEIAIPVGDIIGRLQNRWLARLAETAEEWSAFVSILSRWEDNNLLDNPTPELLADHKATVERLLAFGSSLSLATENRRFPDRRVAEMVAATQVVLQDKLRMWHSPRMSRTESDRLLAACFSDTQ